MIETNKLKKGLIPLIIFLMLILPNFFAFTVSGATGELTIDDWDSYIVGAKSGSNAYVSWKVISTNDHSQIYLGNTMLSAPNSLRYGAIQTGVETHCTLWVNLTDNYDYIGAINMAFKLQSGISGATYSTTYFSFFNGSDVVLQIKFHHDALHFYVSCLDVTDTYQIIYSHPAQSFPQSDCYLNLTHTGTNMFHYVFDDDGTKHHRNDTCYMGGIGGVSYVTFDRIKIVQSESGVDNTIQAFYFDDMVMDVTAYEGENGYESFDDYKQWCSVYPDAYMTIYDDKYLEHLFDASFSGKIHGVDLYVSNDQINQVSGTLSDYGLYINGIPMGSPSWIIDAYGQKALRWHNANGITLDNEKPLFSFKSSALYLRYHWFGIGVDMSPEFHSKKHDSDSYYIDTIYNGNTQQFPIAMCFYTSSVLPPTPPTYNDTVYTQPKGTDTYHELENIIISYQLKIVPNSYMQLWYNATGGSVHDVQFEGQGYFGNGRHLLQQTGIENFVPMETHNGSWQVRLVRSGGTVAFYNFTVINRDDDDYNAQIFTTPNPSFIGEEFIIGWLYNSSAYEGKSARVIYTTTPYLTDFYNLLVTNINGDDLTGHYFTLFEEDVYYFWLCILDNGTMYPLDSCRHLVGDYTFTGDYIDVEYDVYVLNTERSSIPKAFVTISYGHTYPYSDVYINFPNTSYMQYYVGALYNDEVEFDFSQTGFYTVELILYQGEDYIVLDDDTFMIVAEDIIPEEDDELFGLPAEYMNAMFGSFITLGFLIIPFALSRSHKGDTSSVVYAIFGGLGLGVSTLAGFFPLWLPLMITLLVVTILVIEYKRGQ